MIALSTYSGECDGLGLAAEMAGIEVAAYCEADPKRRTRLAEKHPGKPIFESDTEVTADALRKLGIHPDIIFGGPPCQPFSVAGAGRGTADPRHRWPEMLRLIQEQRPRWVVVENVGGFVNLALDLVWSDLEAEGYEAGAVVLPALAVGAPHRRDRCFVVAHAGSVGLRESGICGEQQRRTETIGASQDRCMAHTIGLREQQSGGSVEKERGRAIDGREGMANAKSGRLQVWASKPHREDGGSGSVHGGMEHSGSPGCEELHAPEIAGTAGHASGRSDPQWLGGAAQSRLGGVLAGISDRLDEQMSRWPAWRGQEQYPWEPPRTATGIKERTRRVESLGLSVVPWQAYPIFALIKEVDNMIEEG